MKIVHICLACFFPDNHSYQENLLPKFHKELGLDVEVIASLVTFDRNGKTTFYNSAKQYYNENEILVTRLNYRKGVANRKLRRYIGLRNALEAAAPDIIFIHGCQFYDVRVIVSYLKSHNNIKVYCDNHADFSNSATNWISRKILHGFVWKRCAKVIEPYTTRFYGVLPARVDFLIHVYKLPPAKCELLVMGADDELVETAANPDTRQAVRRRHGVGDDDLLIITGGKIDAYKTQTLLLMEAVGRLKAKRIKLIVFGSVIPELTKQVQDLTDGEKIQYIGWIESKESYRYFAAADLVVFPGRHSVLWEQTVAQGVPMICKMWKGTTHVDLGGNVRFLQQDSADEIQEILEFLLNNPHELQKMKDIAVNKGMKEFSYREIAKKSISNCL